jgi:hypothetical protein
MLDFPTVETVPMPVATKHAAPEPGTLKATALASFVAIRTHAAKLAEKYRAVAYDVTTPKGMAAAKDARLELREEGRFAVQRLRDRLKDEANDLKRVVTDEAEAVIKIIAPVEDAIDSQIKAEETRRAAEKAEAARILAERQQKQAEGVAGIRAYLSRAQTTADMTAARVANGIAMLQGMTFAADDWLDPVAAANAQCETLEGMRNLHTTLLAREEAAAAAEAQRLENERVAAELAEQRRKADAEQARIAGIMARIAEIRAAATGHERATAADLYEARVAVAALDTSEAVYAEFATLANATQLATLAVLDKFHVEATDREAAEAQRRAEVERVLSIPLPLTIPEETTEGQDDPQVLKAEPATADATAGSVPANTSPRVGAMGAGQAADTAPAAELLLQDECRELSKALAADPAAPLHAREAAAAIAAPLPEPTMTLGDLNAWLSPLKIDGAGLESLGFPAAGRRKAAMLYHEIDKPAIVAALHRHLQSL